EVQLFVMADGAVLDGPQPPQPDAPAGGEIHDLARLGTANVLRGDLVSLQLQKAVHEADVARTYIGHAGQHAATPQNLDFAALPRGTELQQIVDEAFHRIRAVARRKSDRRIQPVVGACGAVLRKHEVIHAADVPDRVAHARGDARAEHG